VAQAYFGPDGDVVRPAAAPVVINREMLPADPHDAEIIMGLRTTTVEPSVALVLAFSYRGDNNESSEHIVSAIVNDTVIEIGLVQQEISGGLLSSPAGFTRLRHLRRGLAASQAEAPSSHNLTLWSHRIRRSSRYPHNSIVDIHLPLIEHL